MLANGNCIWPVWILSRGGVIQHGPEQGRMGEWRMVFQGEVKGCPVEIWVYETQDDSDDDPSTPVRITTVLRDTGSGQAREGKGEPQHRIPAGETARTIPIEPYTLDDLDEELMEIGFSREAAAQIISMVRE